MRKLFILMVLVFTGVRAEENSTTFKIWKLFQVHEKSILITHNYEVWELNYLRPYKQTWSEWFYQMPVQDQVGEEYVFQEKLWSEQSSVLCAYYPWNFSQEAQIYRNDVSDLSLCTHILENVDTKEKAFARKICPEDWEKIYEQFNNAVIVETIMARSVELTKQSVELGLFALAHLVFEQRYLEYLKKGDMEKCLLYEKLLEFERAFHFCEIIAKVSKRNPR